MKFKIEMYVYQEEFSIPANKSKSMINALQREAVQEMVELAIPNAQILKVRKVQQEGVCT
jgi:DNA-directed RNA polymerase alpha subunit